MIIVTERKLNIPRSDLVVGCAGDDLVEIRNFELSRFYGDVDLSLFDFKLDTQVGKVKNIIDLAKVVAEETITLTWTIEESHILYSGYMAIQVRAFHGEVEKWHSAQEYVLVMPSINPAAAQPDVLPSEFEQMEQRVTAVKIQAQEAAQTTTEQANRAQGIADTFSNTTLPIAISAVEAAEQAERTAKSHAEQTSEDRIATGEDRVATGADRSAVNTALLGFAETTLPNAIQAVEDKADTEIARVGQASDTQVQAVNVAGAEQIGLATAQADRAEDSASAADAALNKLVNLDVSVETLAPGSNATVSKTETETGYTLAFGVPRGDKGEQGEQGEQGDRGATGERGLKGDKGGKGDTGAEGHTPIKGVDYWTAADQAAIISDVLSALPDGDEEVY